MIGKLISGGVQGIGNAVAEVVGTIWGSASEREAAVHDEQMAVLTQFAAEFAGRPPKTKWDSFVDGLNRLPRPLITFGVIGLFAWAAWSPITFIETMQALALVPDQLWIMLLTIIAFWFGGRFINRDLRKPQVTKEQLKIAHELVERRTRRTKVEDDVVVPVRPEVTETHPPAIGSRFPPVPTGPAPSIPQPTTHKPAATGPAAPGRASPEPERQRPAPERAARDEDAKAEIDRMIADLIDREGGFVNHPADRGGATKYGITRATLANWRGSPVSSHDVKALERSEAVEIYRAVYFFGPGIDNLPAGLQAHVFDIGVNSGPRTAVKLLQRSLNGLGERLKVDGIIGPETRAAAARHPADVVNRELVTVRLGFYEDIVASDPRQVAFIKGWRNRAQSFLPG